MGHLRQFVFHDNPGDEGVLCPLMSDARKYVKIYIQHAIDQYDAVPCHVCLPERRSDQIAYDVYMCSRRVKVDSPREGG